MCLTEGATTERGRDERYKDRLLKIKRQIDKDRKTKRTDLRR